MSDLKMLTKVGQTTGTQNTPGTLKKVSGGTTNYSDVSIFGNNGVEAIGGIGDNISLSGSGKASAAIKRELDAKIALKASNDTEISNLKEAVEELQQQYTEKLEDADRLEAEYTRKLEQDERAYEKSVQKIKEHQIDLYGESLRGPGKGMSEEQLYQNIQNAIPDAPALDSSIVAKVKSLRSEAAQIQKDIATKNSLIDAKTLENQKLEVEIADLQNKYLTALQSEQTAASSGPPGGSSGNGGSSGGGGDPIGFDFDGDTYDFIVDDGNFDSTSDFLGFENEWEAMQQLDTDGNGTVDMNELKDGGIQLVKTGKDGSQEIVNVDDKRFGSGMSIDLNTYKQGSTGASDNLLKKIDTKDSDGDGIANQSLLGTFKININGQTHEGYNTWDDTDFLSGKFNIENVEKTNPFGPASNSSSNIFSNYLTTKPDSDLEAKAKASQINMQSMKQQVLNEAVQYAKAHPKDENKDEEKQNKLNNFFMFN